MFALGYNITMEPPFDETSPAESPSSNYEILENPIERQIEWAPQNEIEKTALGLARLIKNENGEAYFVGGYPRDLIMREHKEVYPHFSFKPNDIDLATNLLPEQVLDILEKNQIKTSLVGKQFQVVNAVIKIDEKPVEFEIATHRVEGDYGPDRRPKFVAATRNKRDDMARRDFTMNALLFDPEAKTILDYTHGLEDIKERTLRFVGDARERIQEDPLRILRYVRFRNKFQMKFDKTVRGFIQKHANLINNLPGERIKEEMDKILTLPRASYAISTLERVGVLEKILPEIHALIGVLHTPKDRAPEIHQEGEVYTHALKTLNAVNQPEFIEAARSALNLDQTLTKTEVVDRFYSRYGAGFAWANLFHDAGKAQTQEFQEATDGKPTRYTFYGHEQKSLELFESLDQSGRIRFSNEEKKQIKFLIENHMKAHHVGGVESAELTPRVKKKLFRSEFAEQLLFLQLTDSLGNYSENQRPEKVTRFQKAWQELTAFKAEELGFEQRQALGHEISQFAIAALTQGQAFDETKGLPIIGPIKTTVLLLCLEKKIEASQIQEKVTEVKDLLEKNNVIAISNVGEMKAAAQKILEAHYQIHFEDL